jgi:hypothetical protein
LFRFLHTVGRDAAAHRVEITKRDEREKGKERDRQRKERNAKRRKEKKR